MKDDDGAAAAPRRSVSAGGVASYVLIAASVVLAWQIVLQPLLQRAPVGAAIRLAPTSPLVLRRAAESELAAGRTDNAAALSREALVRAPFDVRALRVAGLAEARGGREAQADALLTLAGNWSLRDDPAHAWLIQYRLKQGDYGSAFAHADTLARRREDVWPQIFHLFTLAGTEDPQRALPVITGLLAAAPPWRNAYLASLSETPQDLTVAIQLAILLQASREPLTKGELKRLYNTLLSKRLYAALGATRAQLNRPTRSAVTNGGFADDDAPEPFQWRLAQKAGVIAEVVADDLRPDNPALRVDYDGYANASVAQQLTFLAAGAYRFSAEARIEAGDAERLAWTLVCVPGGKGITSFPVSAAGSTRTAWATQSAEFQIPADCPAQWLRLETRAGERRSPVVVWFDRVEISPLS